MDFLCFNVIVKLFKQEFSITFTLTVLSTQLTIQHQGDFMTSLVNILELIPIYWVMNIVTSIKNSFVPILISTK